MQQLEFSRNDNCKLFLEYFSAIKLHDEEKFFIGNNLDILLKGQSLGIAEVVAVRSFKFIHLSDVLSYIDNGKPLQFLAGTIKKFHPDVTNDTEFDHVILHYTNRNLDLQGNLLISWWQDVWDAHKNLSPNQPAI